MSLPEDVPASPRNLNHSYSTFFSHCRCQCGIFFCHYFSLCVINCYSLLLISVRTVVFPAIYLYALLFFFLFVTPNNILERRQKSRKIFSALKLCLFSNYNLLFYLFFHLPPFYPFVITSLLPHLVLIFPFILLSQFCSLYLYLFLSVVIFSPLTFGTSFYLIIFTSPYLRFCRHFLYILFLCLYLPPANFLFLSHFLLSVTFSLTFTLFLMSFRCSIPILIPSSLLHIHPSVITSFHPSSFPPLS